MEGQCEEEEKEEEQKKPFAGVPNHGSSILSSKEEGASTV
jgi:hypothetical protein